jgi:hypothetical protein
MSLGLNIEKLVGPGRPRRVLTADVVREIEDSDLEFLAATPRNMAPPELKKITERHHGLARLLATGVSAGEAAVITGYDPSRVSTLQNSPAFIELVALYSREVDLQFSSVLQHMSGLSKDALLEIRERIEETPEKFSNRELLAIVTELTDRSVDAGERVTAPTRIELVAPVGTSEGVDGSPTRASSDADTLD